MPEPRLAAAELAALPSPQLRMRAATTNTLRLAGNLDASDQCEEVRPFEERGDDDHRRLHAARGFRLPRHAFERRRADAAEAEAGAEDHQPCAEAGAPARAAEIDARVPEPIEFVLLGFSFLGCVLRE